MCSGAAFDQNEFPTANKILKYSPWLSKIWSLSDLSNDVSMESECDWINLFQLDG